MEIRAGAPSWEHEEGSAELFEYLIEQNKNIYMEKSDIRIVQSLIKGDLPSEHNEKSYSISS